MRERHMCVCVRESEIERERERECVGSCQLLKKSISRFLTPWITLAHSLSQDKLATSLLVLSRGRFKS